jgi:hypothetical protein
MRWHKSECGFGIIMAHLESILEAMKNHENFIIVV